MNDDRFDLASAYLDDAVTPAERARAEADPEVMTLVAELRTLAGRLRDVEPPSDTARDRALTAALDVTAGAPILDVPGPLDPPHATDVAAATAPVAPVPPSTDVPAPVVPIGQARRSSRPSARVLAYAAAALALGAVGVVAANALSSTSGPQDDFAEAPTATVAQTAADDGAADTAGDEVTEQPVTPADDEDAERDPAAEADAPDMATDEPLDAEPADETGVESLSEDVGETDERPGAEPPTTVTATGATSVVVVDVDLADLSEAELAAAAVTARTAREDDTTDTVVLEPLPPACAAHLDDLVALARYDGADAYLGVTNQLVRVVDPLGCAVLAETDGLSDD